jgi:hypothetical protein
LSLGYKKYRNLNFGLIFVKDQCLFIDQDWFKKFYFLFINFDNLSRDTGFQWTATSFYHIILILCNVCIRLSYPSLMPSSCCAIFYEIKAREIFFQLMIQCFTFDRITLCIFYHLNELHGMTKWTDKFKIFSLTEQRVEDVVNNCGSLILKAQELNFVVDQNMKEIKLFFKWLHSSIIHLTDDQAVTEMLNEEMENSILTFINNTFKDDQTINLEKVGQYLKSENLRLLVNEDNEWQQFVRHNLDQKGKKILPVLAQQLLKLLLPKVSTFSQTEPKFDMLGKKKKPSLRYITLCYHITIFHEDIFV